MINSNSQIHLLNKVRYISIFCRKVIKIKTNSLKLKYILEKEKNS